MLYIRAALDRKKGYWRPGWRLASSFFPPEREILTIELRESVLFPDPFALLRQLCAVDRMFFSGGRSGRVVVRGDVAWKGASCVSVSLQKNTLSLLRNGGISFLTVLNFRNVESMDK